jgi:hypothetical protein
MKITPEKFAAVLGLAAPKRYSHFVKVAADQNRVWGLYSDGWALMGTDDGKQVFPVWPAEAYAAACAEGSWVGYQPRAIELVSLFDELLPSLRRSGTLLGIFPTPSDRGITPTIEQLEDDLRSELARIE